MDAVFNSAVDIVSHYLTYLHERMQQNLAEAESPDMQSYYSSQAQSCIVGAAGRPDRRSAR